MFELYCVEITEQLMGLSENLCCKCYTMITVDKTDSTEMQFKGKETSLDKFGTHRNEVTMSSSRIEADG